VNNAAAPPVVYIDAGYATSAPGTTVPVPVNVCSFGFGIVTTSNDLGYRNDLFDLDVKNCTVNPAIGRTLAASVLPPGPDLAITTVRIVIHSPQDAAPWR